MKKNEILVFSSDPSVISPLKDSYDVDAASSRSEVLKKAAEAPGILAVIDCDMKDVSGLSLYKEIKKLSPASAVIMLSSTVTIPEAVEASKVGVADFIRKPALSERLLTSVKSNLLRHEGAEIKLTSRPGEWMLGSGSKIRTLFKNIEFAVRERKNILFITEPGIDILSLVKVIRDYSGGGKKLAVIDMLAFRKESLENIFWMVLQEAIASSNIIYFEKFSAADEEHQASILDYIKSKALKGNVTVTAGVQDSGESAVFADWEKIIVPRLRERREDFPDMLEAYIGKYCIKYGKRIEGITLDALKTICSYSWPGNYREFECVIENAVIANEGGAITIRDIQMGNRMVFESMSSSQTENLLDFNNRVEKSLVDIFLKKTGSEDMTANLLDVPKSRISENLRK
jgi:DNA-binding NtrC family response regulator